ncbi:MAG: hypothetical protein MJZ25_04155 [Fibrobacter sp.]|nr:hypothetical protein [Fibrobacter sp.]
MKTGYEIFAEGVKAVCDSDEKAMKVLSVYAPRFEAADGKGRNYETLKTLSVWLLTEANILNIYHWNVGISNKHELLNDAYELCRDTGDAMAEAYIALTGNDCTPSAIELPQASSWAPSDDEILEVLKSINKHMNSAVEKNPNFSEGVKNMFADFDEAMTSIIYKYSRFGS